MIRLFTSNRLEILAENLVEVLRQPLSFPLDQEVIVVQSRGMEHWLSMQVAKHQGICCNTRFPFPNSFVREVFHNFLGEAEDHSPFDPDVLIWRVMGLLPELKSQPGFEILNHY